MGFLRLRHRRSEQSRGSNADDVGDGEVVANCVDDDDDDGKSSVSGTS